MLPIPFESLDDVALAVAARARALRLSRLLTQQGLADRAGVTLASLKRFERTGQISFASLLRIASVLDALPHVQQLFAAPEARVLDEVLAARVTRKRGRHT
jgi:transcriptional regulator with XRE-family HTH domain